MDNTYIEKRITINENRAPSEVADFFKKIQERILETTKCFSRVYGTGVNFNWKDRITEDELKEIERILDVYTDIYIKPQNMDWGFSVGFIIKKITHIESFPPGVYPSDKPHTERLFIFSQQALPKSMSVEDYFPIVNKDKNKELFSIGEPGEHLYPIERYEY